MDDLELNKIQQHWDTLISSAISWAPRIFTAIISALLIYLIGSWMIRMIKKLVEKLSKKYGSFTAAFSFKYYQLGT